jgi:hypothetical protein
MSCQSGQHAEIIADCSYRDLVGLRSNHIYPSGNFSIVGPVMTVGGYSPHVCRQWAASEAKSARQRRTCLSIDASMAPDLVSTVNRPPAAASCERLE